MGLKLKIALCLVTVLPLVGCAFCASPFDEHYGAEGGVWERRNPTEGRVGSAFSSAGSAVGEPTEATVAPELTTSPEAYYEALPPEASPVYR